MPQGLVAAGEEPIDPRREHRRPLPSIDRAPVANAPSRALASCIVTDNSYPWFSSLHIARTSARAGRLSLRIVAVIESWQP